MNPSSIIESRLRERAGRLRDPKTVADILGQPFVLAGWAMRPAEPRDYDLKSDWLTLERMRLLGIKVFRDGREVRL